MFFHYFQRSYFTLGFRCTYKQAFNLTRKAFYWFTFQHEGLSGINKFQITQNQFLSGAGFVSIILRRRKTHWAEFKRYKRQFWWVHDIGAYWSSHQMGNGQKCFNIMKEYVWRCRSEKNAARVLAEVRGLLPVGILPFGCFWFLIRIWSRGAEIDARHFPPSFYLHYWDSLPHWTHCLLFQLTVPRVH